MEWGDSLGRARQITVFAPNLAAIPPARTTAAVRTGDL
ncbi:hypothetical protein FRUB_10184 [Fimbriiglobus ruber]|uniref:Uncharacterized protein n=1 Tax=Fimbriiglobus ruber TaxID=1908690 RepID=A0A225CZU8_9BACT|nr:hypothetical protein FRUB_10184 [Fimbriiglobus ruber]